jgi:hypothetical protein
LLPAAVSAPRTAQARQGQAVGRKALTLTGRVVESKLTDDGSGSMELSLKLSLQLTNNVTRPVLLLRREPWTLERKIVAYPADAEGDAYLYWQSSYPSNGRSPETAKVRRRLDEPSPPPDLIRELAPGETMTFEIEDGANFDKKPHSTWHDKPWDEIRQSALVWFQVRLEMWEINVETPDASRDFTFGRALRRRWQRFGDLRLQPLTSEPMPLDLSSLTSNVARQK